MMTGMMDETGRKGRLWIEDIEDGCQTDVYGATQITQDREAWKNRVTSTMDTYGLSTHI